MHDKNDNEKLFIMMLNSENIKKKAKKIFIDLEIKKNINKISFSFMYSKIYQLFQQKKIFRNECNKLKTIFIKLFTHL